MPETSVYLGDFRPHLRQPSAADLCLAVPCMTPEHTNEKVLEVFSHHRDLVSLPVVEGAQPIGLINRTIFLSQISKPSVEAPNDRGVASGEFSRAQAENIRRTQSPSCCYPAADPETPGSLQIGY